MLSRETAGKTGPDDSGREDDQRVIDDYELLGKLGEGGMGEVYRAQQKSLGRTVAIKFIRPDAVDDPEMPRRFVREGMAAARFSHPNIVKIYEAGQEEGRLYLAMELIRGRTLNECVALMPTETREHSDSILLQLLDALAALHAGGVIHRDLKPDNVMVREDWSVVLMDFSLMKDMRSRATLLTTPGSVVGTPSYLAPELLRAEPTTPRADIWSLGLLYYFIQTRQNLFLRETLGETLDAILEAPLPDFKTACPELTPDRRDFLESLLARSPPRRLPDGAVALERFQQIVDPVTRPASRTFLLPPRPGPWESVPRAPRRALPQKLAAALFLASIIIGWWNGRRSAVEPSGSHSTPAPSPSRPEEVLEGLRHILAALLPGDRSRQLARELDSLGPQGIRTRSARLAAVERCRGDLVAAATRLDLGRLLERLPLGDRIPPGMEAAWAPVYTPLMELGLLQETFRGFGIEAPYDLREAFPPDHRPVETDPGTPGDVVLVDFKGGSGALAKEPHRRVRQRMAIDGVPMMLWKRGVIVFPIRDQYLERLKKWHDDPTIFQTGERLSLRPPGPGERLLLGAQLEELTWGKRLEVAWSPDGTHFGPSIYLSGPDQVASIRYHWISGRAVPGPVFLRLRYGDCGYLENAPDTGEPKIQVNFVTFTYLR